MSMDRLFGKIKQLPTIPKLLHELMQSFNDENARIDEIAAKIAMDQVISVKVLRMANSAALRRGNEVTSIEQAVIRLGFNRLRSVVVASGIISSFKAPPGFDKHRFWTQTFQVATIARTLAQQTRAVVPETAFTCALIHNIGELLIQSTLPEEAGLINLAIEKGSSRVEAQREMLGYDYAQLGAELGIVVTQHLPLGLDPAAPLLDGQVDEPGLLRQGALDQQLADVVNEGTGEGGLRNHRPGLLGQGAGYGGDLEGLGPEAVLVETGGGLEAADDAGGDHHGAQPVEAEPDHRLLDGGHLVAPAQGGGVGHPQHLDADHLVHGDLGRDLVDAGILVVETLHQLVQQLGDCGQLLDLAKQAIHRHG